MSDAPEVIWAVTEPNDVSADILGDVYAQQLPDGMNGTPVKYVRADRIEELSNCVAVLEEKLSRYDDLVADKINLRSENETLKAKLAKAVAFLQDQTGAEWPYDEDAKRILAELTGGKDDE